MSVDSDVGPFAIVPEWVLRAVSPQAVALYAELALHADRKTAKAWPSRARLAERLGISSKSVDRHLKELVDTGAIEKHPRRDETGWHSSLYLVRYVSPGTPKVSPRPSPKDVAQNQNHSEPEPRTIENTPSFEKFWAVYPRKIGKGTARLAWTRALGAATPDQITTAAQLYADSVQDEETRYIAHPSSWLNGERWTDELVSGNGKPAPAYYEPYVPPSDEGTDLDGFAAAARENPWNPSVSTIGSTG